MTSPISAGWPSYKSINQPIFLHQSLCSGSFRVQRIQGGRFVDQDPVATPCYGSSPLSPSGLPYSHVQSFSLLPTAAQSPPFLFTCDNSGTLLSLARLFHAPFLSYLSSFFLSLSLCHRLHRRREVGQQASLPSLLWKGTCLAQMGDLCLIVPPSCSNLWKTRQGAFCV